MKLTSPWLSHLTIHWSSILLATLSARSTSSLATTTTARTMTWANTWDNILSGGPPRWKVDDLTVKQQALARLQDYSAAKSSSLKILCPLAGDDPFVAHAWKAGHDVTAIDLVPAAVQAMRRQFGDQDDWTCEEKQDDATVVWRHKSGRATLYVGDVMQERPELYQTFDAVYDKDAFGALSLDLRRPYCARLAQYCKPNAVVYTEVKQKDGGKAAGGPPYHIEKEDLMEMTSFGTDFEHVIDLGEVYALNHMSGVKQTGHILKRK